MKAALVAIAAALALGSTASLTYAQPSQYFLWQNKTTKKKMCEPQAPSAEWVKLSGPYEDPNCSIAIKE